MQIKRAPSKSPAGLEFLKIYDLPLDLNKKYSYAYPDEEFLFWYEVKHIAAYVARKLLNG